MDKQYKYVGVNRGCAIASSNGSGNEATDDKAEIYFAKLEQAAYDKKIQLTYVLGEVITECGAIGLFTDGDNDVIARFINNKTFGAWGGHIAKVEGVWMISREFARLLYNVFDKKMTVTKKHKDLNLLVNVLKTTTNGYVKSYSSIVDQIMIANNCGRPYAKNLFTRLVKDNHIVKVGVGSNYKVE